MSTPDYAMTYTPEEIEKIKIAATCKICFDSGTIDDDGPNDGCKEFSTGFGFAFCNCAEGDAARAEYEAGWEVQTEARNR